MTKLKLIALTTATVTIMMAGLQASQSNDEAPLDTLTIEELRNGIRTSVEQLIEATNAQRAISNNQEALAEATSATDMKRETLEEQISVLEKNYERFSGEVKKYNRKCDKAFTEDDPELKKCFEWQEDLKAAEDELDQSQSSLERAGAKHDLRQKELTTRQSEVAANAAAQRETIHGLIARTRSIRAEADHRKWFGCVEKDLCDNVKRLEKCMRAITLTCRTGCLQSILDGTSPPSCE